MPPGRVVLDVERVTGPVGQVLYQGCAVLRLGRLGAGEVEDLLSRPDVIEEVGLPDPSASVEERKLRGPPIKERGQFLLLSQTVDNRWNLY